MSFALSCFHVRVPFCLVKGWVLPCADSVFKGRPFVLAPSPSRDTPLGSVCPSVPPWLGWQVAGSVSALCREAAFRSVRVAAGRPACSRPRLSPGECELGPVHRGAVCVPRRGKAWRLESGQGPAGPGQLCWGPSVFCSFERGHCAGQGPPRRTTPEGTSVSCGCCSRSCRLCLGSEPDAAHPALSCPGQWIGRKADAVIPSLTWTERVLCITLSGPLVSLEVRLWCSTSSKPHPPGVYTRL